MTNTTNIPDEAVQAAIRSFESTENNCETYQDMRKAISSAIQKICENIDFYDIKNELFGEMSRRFKNEKYIWESWKDFYPNPEYLPVDDTEIGVEFAFNFLERRILSCVVTKPVDALTAAEAVYGVLGWLTSRNETVVLGASHGAAIGAELATEFCKVNNLGDCRDSFPKNLKHPTTTASQPVDVAAVRRQALEEGFENGVEQSLNALDAYDDITRNEAEQSIRKLKPDYRALSAAPTTEAGK